MEEGGATLRMLSRSSSSTPSSGVAPQSPSPSSIPFSSASIPYTPPPPPPTSSGFSYTLNSTNHSIPPSYPPSPCPPLPSQSLLNPASSKSFPPSGNTIHPGSRITILTSSASASSLASAVPVSSGASNIQSDAPFNASSVPAHSVTDTNPVESPVNGVVVVGVVGRSEIDVSQLLDRLLDAQVFGSKHEQKWDSNFPLESREYEIKAANSFTTSSTRASMLAAEWASQGHVSHSRQGKDSMVADLESGISQNPKALRRLEWIQKRLKYYHDEEKGIVYVQFSWGFPASLIGMDGLPVSMEECERNMMRGLLYMFSVCHVILLLHENGRFDTHLLRTLRVLQTAKHMLAPFVKSHVLPGLHSRDSSGERGPSINSSSSSTSQSPGRASARSASTISLMSGSAPSFFPGQCTPVLLFVFLEDFSDTVVGSSHERLDTSMTQVPQGPILATRQTVQLKGSNPVVMLARAASKTEGGLRKKLQSSLEAQVKYLVKKCKILAGSGDTLAVGGSGIGPRGPGGSMATPSGASGGSSLFVLDTMRVACLLNRNTNFQGDSLEAAMGVLNDMLNGKSIAGNALTDLTGTGGEDIQAIRDFVWKQTEILRGRGGVLSNSAGGSMGVGMVAAAAAAAAASAAAGSFGGSGGSLKPSGNPPELPSIASWLSACHILIEALVVGEGNIVKDVKKVVSIRVSGGTRRGAVEPVTVPFQGKDALGLTLASLECGADLDMKFSTDWCKRLFPSALNVYMKALPPCYPTVLHESHLQKALHMFQRKVRGPAVPAYINKLKDECQKIWKSGRQLCDAVSLTGRPCIHKAHDVLPPMEMNICTKEGEKQHRLDENFAQSHSSGLVFLHACACGRSRKLREDPFDYVSANTTFYQFPNCEELLPSLIIPDCEGNKPMGGSAWSLIRLGGTKYYQQSSGLLQSGFSHNKKYLAPWVLSYCCTALTHVRNGFSVQLSQCKQQEVASRVSGPLVGGTLSFLDALEQGKESLRKEIDMELHMPEKVITNEMSNKIAEKMIEQDKKQAWEERRLFADVARYNPEGHSAFPPLQQRQTDHKNAKYVATLEKKDVLQRTGQADPQKPSPAVVNYLEEKKTISMSVPGAGHLDESLQDAASVGIKHALLYVGFEHECPHGHRFFLSHEQVEQLGPIGIDTEHHKLKYVAPSKKVVPDMDSAMLARNHSVSVGQENPVQPALVNIFGTAPECKILNYGSGEGYTLLNTNLPIYMACPYCTKSSEKKKKSSVSFAGNISQLQRIFLVTPPLPLLVAACPTVQFSDESLSHAIGQHKKAGSDQFSLGCNIVLPPESLIVLRLPFIYFVELEDGSKFPLRCNASKPESSGWLLKGSAFRVISDTSET